VRELLTPQQLDKFAVYGNANIYAANDTKMRMIHFYYLFIKNFQNILINIFVRCIIIL